MATGALIYWVAFPIQCVISSNIAMMLIGLDRLMAVLFPLLCSKTKIIILFLFYSTRYRSMALEKKFLYVFCCLLGTLVASGVNIVEIVQTSLRNYNYPTTGFMGEIFTDPARRFCNVVNWTAMASYGLLFLALKLKGSECFPYILGDYFLILFSAPVKDKDNAESSIYRSVMVIMFVVCGNSLLTSIFFTWLLPVVGQLSAQLTWYIGMGAATTYHLSISLNGPILFKIRFYRISIINLNSF